MTKHKPLPHASSATLMEAKPEPLLPALLSPTVLLVTEECVLPSGLAVDLKHGNQNKQKERERKKTPKNPVPVMSVMSPSCHLVFTYSDTVPCIQHLHSMSCRHSLIKGPGQTGLEPGQATLPSQGLTPCPCFLFFPVHSWGGLTAHTTYMNTYKPKSQEQEG